MRLNSPDRVTKAAVASSIILLLLAMLLPVCHLHPLLAKGAPDHCTICISLHAAVPVAVHLSLTAVLFHAGRVLGADTSVPTSRTVALAASRAPPFHSADQR